MAQPRPHYSDDTPMGVRDRITSEGRFFSLETDMGHVLATLSKQDGCLERIEKTLQSVSEYQVRQRGFVRWVGGIAGTLIAGLALCYLGLK